LICFVFKPKKLQYKLNMCAQKGRGGQKNKKIKNKIFFLTFSPHIHNKKPSPHLLYRNLATSYIENKKGIPTHTLSKLEVIIFGSVRFLPIKNNQTEKRNRNWPNRPVSVRFLMSKTEKKPIFFLLGFFGFVIGF